MTTERKRAANRRNAARSTGPISAAGKARSRTNALSHGLAASITGFVQLAEIEQLALALAGTAPTPQMIQHARTAAAAELDLMRVRAARADFISRAAADLAIFAPLRLVPEETIEELRSVVASASAGIFEGGSTTPAESLERAILWNEYQLSRPPPNEDEKPAMAFGRHFREISRYDRYERRALSRRKRALRALDQLRAVVGVSLS